MSVFLLAGDFKRLWTFFVLRQAAQLEGPWVPSFENKWLQRSRFALQVFVPLGFALLIIPDEKDRYKSVFETQLKVSSLSGIWEADGDAGSVPPAPVWRRVVLDGGRRIAVWTPDGQLLRFAMKLDKTAHKMNFKGWRNDHVCDFTYEEAGTGRLVLKGRMDQLPVEIKLNRVSTRAFFLQTRGFHWISEDPYNM